MSDRTNDTRDFFQILGVTRDANDVSVKKAWRGKARELHPDTHSGDKEREEELKLVNIAYEALKTPDGRSNYLSALNESKRQGERRDTRRTQTRVRVNDFVDEDGNFDFTNVDYWLKVFRAKGYPENDFFRNMAEGAAAFHGSFEGKFGGPGLNMDFGFGRKSGDTPQPGTLEYFRKATDKEGVLTLGVNNANLLAVLVEIQNREGDVNARVLQRETGKEGKRELETAYRGAGVAYEVERRGGEVIIRANPLQLLDNLNRIMFPRQAELRRLDLTKTYRREELWGIGGLDMGFLANMTNLAEAIGRSEGRWVIMEDRNRLRSWENSVRNGQVVELRFATIENDLSRLRREGAVMVETVSMGGAEQRR